MDEQECSSHRGCDLSVGPDIPVRRGPVLQSALQLFERDCPACREICFRSLQHQGQLLFAPRFDPVRQKVLGVISASWQSLDRLADVALVEDSCHRLQPIRCLAVELNPQSLHSR